MEEQVRQRAYQLWQESGCPEGDGQNFWLQAEAELNSGLYLSSTEMVECCGMSNIPHVPYVQDLDYCSPTKSYGESCKPVKKH